MEHAAYIFQFVASPFTRAGGALEIRIDSVHALRTNEAPESGHHACRRPCLAVINYRLAIVVKNENGLRCDGFSLSPYARALRRSISAASSPFTVTVRASPFFAFSARSLTLSPSTSAHTERSDFALAPAGQLREYGIVLEIRRQIAQYAARPRWRSLAMASGA